MGMTHMVEEMRNAAGGQSAGSWKGNQSQTKVETMIQQQYLRSLMSALAWWESWESAGRWRMERTDWGSIFFHRLSCGCGHETSDLAHHGILLHVCLAEIWWQPCWES